MKYCTQCGSEYQDGVTACSDDGNTELVPAEEMRRRNLPMMEGRDDRRFVPAGAAEDPLSSQRFTEALQAQNIPVIARPRRAGTVDTITSGSVSPWWDILVPEEHLARATEILAEAAREIEAGADEASRAAEEEAGQS